MNIQVIVPQGAELGTVFERQSLPPFADLTVEFVDALSRTLLALPAARDYPELVALGYWLRKSHVRRLQDRFVADARSDLRLPRGLAFHIAPSNVDTIFVYSWAISMLCGNPNVLRVSSRGGEQIDLLLGCLDELVRRPEFSAIRDRVRVVRYGRDDAINRMFSEHCAIRVIWGGDATVAAIRALPLPATSVELAFADKFSLVMIDAQGWLGLTAEDQARQAELFRADVSGFNQQACSSPRLIVWVGETGPVAAARDNFWHAVAAAPEKARQPLTAADASNRIAYAQSAAILAGARVDSQPGESFVRLWLDAPDTLAGLPFCGAGVLLEAGIARVAEIEPLLTRRIQTMAVAGFSTERLRIELGSMTPGGIDRVVPFGHALDFDLVWDGVDLFEAFTRRITFP